MILTVDAETYYARDYTLTRMTTSEYNLDPRFQPIMLSLKVDDQPTEVLVGDKAIRSRLATIDPGKTALLSHHINFDGSILHWHYGFVPQLYLCTLSMARAITHWVIGKSSLAALSTHLGLPPKGDEVVRAIGKRLENFTDGELNSYSDYCVRDNENCRAVFDRLRPYFTNAELAVIDLIARMFIVPQVRLNAGALAVHLAEVRARKAEAFDRLGYVDRDIFSSQPRFAAYLKSLGVDVPLKPSPTGEGMIPALAKGDRAFRELCEDPTLPMDVQVALAVRLEAKSTIEETRTERLLTQARLRWPGADQGWLPVPLKYYAARTGRLGGDDKLNLQNLPRGSAVRAALEAPPGMRVVHRDASQIEARMVAWLAQCEPLLDAFREGRDVYCEFASDLYKLPVTPADKLRRFVGKTAILGLGYGCGADKFRHMLFIGNGGVSMKVEVTDAQDIVNHYRALYPSIPKLWRFGNKVIDKILEPNDTYTPEKSHIPVTYGEDKVFLPNEMYLHYPELKRQINAEGKDEVVYKNAYKSWTKLYGAKFCLGADTNVLTSRGWVPIVEILPFDFLWDGEEWVIHHGVVCNGRASTITVDGVEMTVDHKVLAEEGWRNGAACEGYNRAPVWLPDRYAARWVDPDGYWSTTPVGGSLRLRPGVADDLIDLLQGGAEVVRMPPVRDDRRRQPDTRDVEASSVCSMAIDGGPLHAADAPSLGELRGAGDYRVPRVAIVRDFLGRHGSDIQIRPDDRTQGQRGWVFSGKLRVGNLSQADEQQAQQRADWNAYGSRDIEADRHRPYHAAVPHSGRGQPVYDIINAGPRNRFVVAGIDSPFIVHNCENLSQALSRIVITDIALRIYNDTRVHPFLSTHDSLDYCVGEDEVEWWHELLEREFAIVPAWAEAREKPAKLVMGQMVVEKTLPLPLASEGGWGRNLLAAERGENR